MQLTHRLVFGSLQFLIILCHVFAYVPASPTNNTDLAIAAGLNISDVSKLYLQWDGGNYNQTVSYQLVGSESNGLSKGVLVHFSEVDVNNSTPPTSVPWIAMISCDFNATDADQEIDIFTLARDKGASAALLYSLDSEACVINPEYADPETFDQVFDIFSTKSRISAGLIERQFNASAMNRTYTPYNSQLLNDSASVISDTMEIGYPQPGFEFMFAVLHAYNATINPYVNSGSTTGGNVSTHSPGTGNSGGSGGTTLPMIILYTITGCVSALFCIVIISGAIRAIRHPERYGPRAHMNDDGDGPQSRAHGLTRAIIDTFPVVKFGPAPTNEVYVLRNPPKDVEGSRVSGDSHPDSHTNVATAPLTMNQIIKSDVRGTRTKREINSIGMGHASVGDWRSGSSSGSNVASSDLVVNNNSSTAAAAPAHVPSNAEPSLEAMGRETCPICIVDFEEGDDLRVLPCEAHHRFHQACVDPWLLELSSSCPLCRQDFQTLEEILSGSIEGGHENYPLPTPRPPREHNHNHQTNRFSRYLRFAHTRRTEQRRQDESDPTDPYMPTVPATSMYPPV